MRTGPKITTSGLIFGYDMDSRQSRFHKGEPTENLVPNPDGANIKAGYEEAGSYDPAGWDSSINTQATYPDNGWSPGYNGGVTNPDVGYHAKWIFAPNGKAVMKFQDENTPYSETHRWMGINNTGIGSPTANGIVEGTDLTVSWDQKSTSSNKGARVGLYYYSIAAGTRKFNSYITTTTVAEAGVWERRSLTWTVNSDWDLSISFYLYCYGYQNDEAILWCKNFQLEKKDHATPFVVGDRTNTNSLVDMKRTTTIDTSTLLYDSNAHAQFSSGSYIDLGNSATLNPTSMTISVWAKFSSFSTYQCLVSRWSATAAQRAYFLSNYNNTGELAVWFASSGGSYSNLRSNSSTELNLDTWYNIVSTYDESTDELILYKNGLEVPSYLAFSSATGAIQSTTSTTGIGYDVTRSIWPFDGYIDIVKIFDTAITPEQVLRDYNSQKTRFGL
jgi:hypothetical protein